MLFNLTPFNAPPDKLSAKPISHPSEVAVSRVRCRSPATEHAHTETQELRQEVRTLRYDLQRVDRDRQQDRAHMQDALDGGLQQLQLELHLDLHEELAHERAQLRTEICQQLRDELCAGLRPHPAQESAQLQEPRARVERRRDAWKEVRVRQERRRGLVEQVRYIILQCFVIVYAVILAIRCFFSSLITTTPGV